MKYLYRVDERSQYQIKSLYYFNVKKDPDKAMAVAEMWARLYSGDVMAQQQIVQFAVMRGEISKALRAYDRILEIDDSQHEVLQKAAKLLRMEGRFEEAEEKLLRYAELYPEEVRSYARLVDLYEDMGALDKAKAAVEQSLLIEPDDQATMLQLANLEKKLGRFEEMERILTQVLENDPVGMVHANALGAWASLQQSRGQWRAARATYDQWRQVAARAGMHPSQATSSYASSISRLATIAAAPAILAELEALRQDLTPPNDQVLGLCRAQVRVVQGQPDQALVDLAETEEFIELYKIEILRSSALMIRGLIAEVDGRHDEAADFMQQATELTPTSTLITIALGRTQRKAGRLADARETLATALRGDPGNPEIKWQLGLTLRALGRGEEGDRYLREAAEVWRDADADHPGATELRELGFGI
ncbi:hypothetical protein CSB20_13805 [bacterium DOLZORAL124_64_63]|nr:MAG: hypothetical protein CSB20_13805 [bacterium DOLZORAL124_64_63]